jgi:uncharacterized protein YnzC (UPF0291/DUF896 family)
MIPPRIKEISVLDDFKINIIYVTGEEKVFDMKDELKNSYYEKLNNKVYFMQAKNAEVTIEWPDGEDVDPNKLYENSVKVK